MPTKQENLGTALGPDDSALVIDTDGQARLCLPNHGDDDEVPRHILFLTAVMMKLDDEAWVESFIADCFKQD